MLALTRKIGESVDLFLDDGSAVTIIVTGIDRGHVRLSFAAPSHIPIVRSEIAPGAPGGGARFFSSEDDVAELFEE